MPIDINQHLKFSKTLISWFFPALWPSDSAAMAAQSVPEPSVTCDFSSMCLCGATSSLSALGGTNNTKNQRHVSSLFLYKGTCDPGRGEVLSVYLFTDSTQ